MNDPDLRDGCQKLRRVSRDVSYVPRDLLLTVCCVLGFLRSTFWRRSLTRTSFRRLDRREGLRYHQCIRASRKVW